MKPSKIFLLLVLIAVLISGCVAGSAQFTEAEPAGLWLGIWHGAISVITLIIHIFDRTIRVYEANNTGGWYDFGFLFGVICIWGGGSAARRRAKKKARAEKARAETQAKAQAETQAEKKSDWEEMAPKIEEKIKSKMRTWAEAEPEEDWASVEKKFEEKLRKNLKKWFEDCEK